MKVTVLISENEGVRDGLNGMIEAAGPQMRIGEFEHPDVAAAVIVLAAEAEDRPEWFPRGKWATIQALQARVEAGRELL